MELTWAQAADSGGTSSGLLGFLLSSALLVTITGAYKFAVNFRNTERGMQRKRMRDANLNERKAQHEASLWQSRCGDLEYILKRRGITVPPLGEELRTLVLAEADAAVTLSESDKADEPTGRRPAP